ncbi:MAG: SMP-30/gluconolactonase/LRE family protein [Fermentimonas sp.]
MWIYSPEGKLIQEIEFPESPSNVCFGGKERDTLFVTARTSVYSLKMNVKGVQ